MPVIRNVKLLEDYNNLESGFFLCLIGTSKIPPHIALIANGKYYSTSVKGVKLGVDFNFLLKILETKKTPTLFLKIDELIDQPQLTEVYANYPKLTTNESCLFPIRDYFKLKNWKVDNWAFVFDLIGDLLIKDKIEIAYHLRMEELLENESFKLREYTKEDIITLIKELKALC